MSSSSFATVDGNSKIKKWKKLYDKIPEHENSSQHKKCYIEWRSLEQRVLSESIINDYFNHFRNKIDAWRKLLWR